MNFKPVTITPELIATMKPGDQLFNRTECQLYEVVEVVSVERMEVKLRPLDTTLCSWNDKGKQWSFGEPLP